METIGALLRPHSHQLHHLAMALSCIKLLRGLGVVFRMTEQENTDDISVRSLLGALVLATLGVRVSQLSGDRPMLQINGTSLLLNVGYLAIVYRCASPGYKRDIGRKTLLVVLLIVVCLCYSLLVEPGSVTRHLSLVMTATTLLLILLGLLQRSAAALGCLMSILIVTSKVLYALSVLNTFMLYQNLLVLCLDLLRVGFSLGNSRRSTASGPDGHPFAGLSEINLAHLLSELNKL